MKKIETIPLTGHKLQYISSCRKNVNKNKKDGAFLHAPLVCSGRKFKNYPHFIRKNIYKPYISEN